MHPAVELARIEGMNVDLAFERMAVQMMVGGGVSVAIVGVLVGAVVARGARSHQCAPRRGARGADPRRNGSKPVAVARGLAAENDGATGTKHAAELGEGLGEVGDVVKDGMTEDEVEALIFEWERLRI